MGTEGLKSEMRATITSLYEDGIKPVGNNVKGRLKDRSASAGLVNNFCELCFKFPDVFAVTKPGDDVLVSLVSEPSSFKGFVDIDSPEDSYREEMWQEFVNYLQKESDFPGGRYAAARDLKRRQLPFFAEFSLGQLIHIVQIAIQTRKLLVHHRKLLKSVALFQPQAGENINEIVDIYDLCSLLFRMMKNSPQGLILSRIKQDIQHQFSRSLSELTFDCAKLTDVFTKEPLKSTFVLSSDMSKNETKVRLGDPATFSDRVRSLLADAQVPQVQP